MARARAASGTAVEDLRGERGRRGRDRRDPAATRRALLQAGEALFAERGYDAVPIGELAARAGVNKALISYHFGGKRGLYGAVLASGFGAIAARLKAAETQGGDVRRVLHRFLATFAAMRRQRPAFANLFLREVLSSGVNPAVVPHLVEIVGVVRRLAERGAREGLFRRVDPFLFHFALVGSLVFFVATESARRRAATEGRLPFASPRFSDFLSYLEQLTLRGLAPGNRSPVPQRPACRRKGARA